VMSRRWRAMSGCSLTMATTWNRSLRSTCSPTPRMSRVCVCWVVRSAI